MAQCLVSVVCLAVLPTVQSMQVLSLCKDHCMILQLLAHIMLILVHAHLTLNKINS